MIRQDECNSICVVHKKQVALDNIYRNKKQRFT